MKKIISLFSILLLALSSFAVVTINPATIDTGYCEHSYSFKATASGGSAPYVYTVSVGSLPSGLFLNRTTGRIEGIIHVQTTSSASFTIRAVDALGVAGTRAYTLYILNTELTASEMTTIWTGTTPVSYSNVFDTWYSVFTNPAAISNEKWDISGNTLGGISGIKLGSIDSSDFSIVSKNIDRMVFKGDGKIGIGTGSPSVALHLNGQFRYVDGSQGTAKVLTSDANGVAEWQAPIAGWSLGGNVAVTAQDFGTVDSVDVPFISNNIERMRLLAGTGYLGLGVTPTYPLHLKTANTTIAEPNFRFENSDGSRAVSMDNDGSLSLLGRQNIVWANGSSFSIFNVGTVANPSVFEVTNSGNGVVKMPTIPTDSTGLPSGSLYRDGSTVKWKY